MGDRHTSTQDGDVGDQPLRLTARTAGLVPTVFLAATIALRTGIGLDPTYVVVAVLLAAVVPPGSAAARVARS